MEVGNESQPSFHVFVESFKRQVFEVSDGIWAISQRSFENTHLEFKLIILLLELLDSLFRWDFILSPLSKLRANCTLSLDKSSDEVCHLTFFYLTISIFIELLEEAIELVYCNSRLSLKLHELVQKVKCL